MRHLVVMIAASLASACTSTVLVEPVLHVSPYLAVYELRGGISLQSEGANPGDPLQNNPAQLMRTVGQDHHREDVGIRADFGDGFGGLRVDYYRLDMGAPRPGIIEADWGRLLAGDEVTVRAEMDELRLGWVEPLIDVRTEYRDDPLRLKLAAGGVFAHREMTLRGLTTDQMRSQNVEIEGDVLYVAVRARAEWRDFMLDVDYEISPDVIVSGDYEGVLQDFEANISYGISQRDIRFFAGYRYSDLPAKGLANGFAYDADLIINGFQFGVTVTL